MIKDSKKITAFVYAHQRNEGWAVQDTHLGLWSDAHYPTFEAARKAYMAGEVPMQYKVL